MFVKEIFPAGKYLRQEISKKVMLLSNRYGFTMVEIILMVTLLALAVVPLTTVINYGNKVKVESNVELIAFNLARDKLERFIKNPAELDTLSDGTTEQRLLKNGEPVELSGRFFGDGYEDYYCRITSRAKMYAINNGQENINICELETISVSVYYGDPPPHQKPPTVTLEGEVYRE